MSNEVRNVLRLIAWRQQVIETEENWKDAGNDEALGELEHIQSQILNCNLTNEQSFFLATKLLISGDDDPNFADEFKNELFRNLRRASTAI